MTTNDMSAERGGLLHRLSASQYFVFAVIGILVAILGFNITYIQPVLIGSKNLPPIYHLHGFFGAAWLAIFLAQTFLIAAKKHEIHRLLGVLGAFAAVGVVITMSAVSFVEVERGLADGTAIVNNVVGPLLDAATFGALVALGVFSRANPQAHKRWMLLATILLLWVAWVRLRYYFPDFPNNFDVFGFYLGMAPIPIFWLLEWKRYGRPHPVILWGGLGVLLEQGLQLLLFGSVGWSWAAETLLATYLSIF